MPKKLQTWKGRMTTFCCDGTTYNGAVIYIDSVSELFTDHRFTVPRRYYFKTEQGEFLPIAANGPGKVRAIPQGGLVGSLRRNNYRVADRLEASG